MTGQGVRYQLRPDFEGALIVLKQVLLTLSYQARGRSARARRACALRALGLLLADGVPTVGGGKTF